MKSITKLNLKVVNSQSFSIAGLTWSVQLASSILSGDAVHGEKDCSSFTIVSMLREKVISETGVWVDIIAKVTQAIAHVHSVGFLHDDFKSNNIVLDNISRRYQPVLIDFGKSLPVSGL